MQWVQRVVFGFETLAALMFRGSFAQGLGENLARDDRLTPFSWGRGNKAGCGRGAFSASGRGFLRFGTPSFAVEFFREYLGADLFGMGVAVLGMGFFVVEGVERGVLAGLVGGAAPTRGQFHRGASFFDVRL